MTRRKNGDRQGIQRRETGEEKAENGLKKGREKAGLFAVAGEGSDFFCVRQILFLLLRARWGVFRFRSLEV